MCIVIINFPVNDIINFENNLSFLIKPFSYMPKNVRTKNTLRMNVPGSDVIGDAMLDKIL